MKKTIILFTIIPAIILLAGCAEVDLSNQTENSQTSQTSSPSSSSKTASFKGETGLFAPSDNNGVTIEASSVDDGKAHFFNTALPNGDPVYFFIVKSPDGKLRAAANGCQVCGGALQGFRQEEDYMVCNTCGNRYPLNKIATEKGGCNPAPINPDLKVENGMINISISELQDIRQFFL
ncbi:hypothetical protein COY07_05970 [Candidatus Peregrinibacteria bacterium CG_4_10_14_0_2_um_filter_43_11]|nr:MAG: hypothetical protein COY07_05970 [Candidatus Peregrinibacteria bacterium CG_4_10_14_0_2_um_filter_43_11]